jgi:hypothetical protein
MMTLVYMIAAGRLPLFLLKSFWEEMSIMLTYFSALSNVVIL